MVIPPLVDFASSDGWHWPVHTLSLSYDVFWNLSIWVKLGVYDYGLDFLQEIFNFL